MGLWAIYLKSVDALSITVRYNFVTVRVLKMLSLNKSCDNKFELEFTKTGS